MTNQDNQVPDVTDKRVAPPGILPRNIQPLLIGGLAIVMILVMFFSGRRNPKPRTSAQVASETPMQPSPDRLNEYRQRIEDAARKLKDEQHQLSQTKEAWARASAEPAALTGFGGQGTYSYSPPASSQRSPIQEEKERREYLSRFASNIALSYRDEPKRGTGDASISPGQGIRLSDPRFYSPPIVPPSSAQLPESTREASGAGASSPNDMNATDRAERGEKNPQLDLNASKGKDYRLFEGTIIETTLTNRLDGTFSGPVNCLVTYDVYSHDHNHILIPSGSRILGDVHPVQSVGQQRLAVTFHRLIMPDGFSLSLDQFKGLDQVGETGLRDRINHHYLQIFGASIAIGMIAGLAQSNTQYGISTSAADAYRQGVASSLTQSSMHVLDRFLNVLPTFTIREGQRIKVYLAQDLALPAYENHEMPDDL